MNANAFEAALDRRGPCTLFVRCDDGGWADERLKSLLTIMARHGVPIDVALIPDAVSPALARELAARHGDGGLGLHQHGRRHVNHEPEGSRKGEFGSARSAAALRADLHDGRDRLHALLGSRVDPIFTPPWNRCSPLLPALLAAGGWHALSREVRAVPQRALPELPVHVDWCRVWREAPGDGSLAVAEALAAALEDARPVGLMLHHAAMDDAGLAALDALLSRWAVHPHARWARMVDLVAEAVRCNA